MSELSVAQPITRKVAQFKAKTMAEIYPQTPESIRRAKADQEQQRIRSLAHIFALFSDAIPADRPRVLYQLPGDVSFRLMQLAADVYEELKDLEPEFRAAFMNEARRG